MKQYSTPVVLPQRAVRLEVSGDAAGTLRNTEEPSRAELLAAIQSSRVALEGKIEMVTVEVNLLWADLRKVSDMVKVAEGSIAELQSEVGTLRKLMVQATSTVYGWRRSHFFNRPEEVWRWMEMWDKVAREETRKLEASPHGLLERIARSGDRMALVSSRIRVTE
ncbi:hypothetical protein NDU88_006173 [Pleurodeles waltl]|uniref:Uncharacterized protein n=1 Tax=Pleurodeles waltl TaxID=8319 RepID=A0AAV7UNV1_PLEWA|nr:hypothetical protein NDU88_006173 [Pleurodeles waltl]